MAETGDLIIKIGGDASKFKATIADVENSLKSFKANLGTTGLNIKIEALGFQETKSNIKGVADFAEGTLGAIKNTIKEVKAERLTISADPNSLAPFNIKLNELNTTVKELEKAGILKNVPQEAAVAANSLQGLSNKLTELRKQRAIIDPDTNARAILQINQQIDKLQQKIVNLNNLGQKIDTGGGLAGGFNGIKKGSAEAGRALTSLSLIAQDLPFGFIAIQNNLPAVIQTFGQLKATSQGTIPALQAIGGAILGPAGLFFAFSAVTSVLTVAVQKYGSLGGAIDAYLGKQFALTDEIIESTKAFNEFNKERKSAIDLSNQQAASVAGEATKIKSLLSIVLNQTKGYEERNTALSTLKDIDKVYFGNLDLEKSKYEDLELAVDDYIKKLKQAAVTKGFESELSTISVELSKQEALLTKLNDAVDAARRAPVVIRGIESRVDTQAIDAATEAYRQQKIRVDELKASRDRINLALDESVRSEIGISGVYVERNRLLEEQEKQQSKLGKTTSKRQKDEKDALKLLQEEQRRLNALELQSLFLQNELAQSISERIRKESETRRKDAFENASGKSLLGYKIPDKFPIPKVEIDRSELALFNDELNKTITAYKSNFESLSDVFNDVFDDIVDKNKQIANAVEGFLIQPVETFFDILTKEGEASWKDFGKVVIDTLKKIASQAITTAIAKTLANVLAPGFGSISTEGLEAGFEALYGESIRGGGGQANFGGIRGNQGVNMSGQVVMTLRGADLVGAMNRTNTTISRVG